MIKSAHIMWTWSMSISVLSCQQTPIRQQNKVSSMHVMVFVGKQFETTTAGQYIIARVKQWNWTNNNNSKVQCPTSKFREIIPKFASGYRVDESRKGFHTWDRDIKELYTFRAAHSFSPRNGYTWPLEKESKQEVVDHNTYITLIDTRQQLSNLKPQSISTRPQNNPRPKYSLNMSRGVYFQWSVVYARLTQKRQVQYNPTLHSLSQ
jgi:hypothetical protein